MKQKGRNSFEEEDWYESTNELVGFIIVLIGVLSTCALDSKLSFVEVDLALSCFGKIGLSGFMVGLGIALVRDEGGINILAGLLLLVFPIFMGFLVLRNPSQPLTNSLTTLIIFCYLTSLALGVHSGAWMMQGWRKLQP